MRYVLFPFIFLLVGLLVVFFYKNYTLQQAITKIQTPVAQTTPFSLSIPPKATLKGIIVASENEVRWQAREATEPAMLSQNRQVLQGEEYWTATDGSLEVLFPDTLQVKASENTHINFVQTLPTNFVMLQDNGEVTYTKLRSTIPLGIRVLHLLVSLDSGSIAVTIDETTGLVSLRVTEGSTTIAFNDAETVSNVITVEEGERYVFDNELREGELVATDE